MLKVAIISMVKAPVEQLRMYVHYHLNIGIDEIFLFFDDPLDIAISFFSSYEKVHTIACSSEYWSDKTETSGRPDFFKTRQLININEGARIAKAKGHNWVIHMDCDELINPKEDVKQVLSDCRVDAVRFTLMEAVAKMKYDNIFQPTLFRKETGTQKIFIAKCLGYPDVIFENKYFRGHTRSKMAVRVSDKIKTFRVHRALKHSGKLDVELTEKIQLLHFDCIDFDDWKMKRNTRLREDDASHNMGPGRRKQFESYRDAKKQGIEKQTLLFKKIHCVSMRERLILGILRMVTTIRLNTALFENSDTGRVFEKSV